MPAQERMLRAARMRESIEREDIGDWLCRQIETLVEIPSP
jgi:hypothetical protein